MLSSKIMLERKWLMDRLYILNLCKQLILEHPLFLEAAMSQVKEPNLHKQENIFFRKLFKIKEQIQALLQVLIVLN
jgi:hypothetical protein